MTTRATIALTGALMLAGAALPAHAGGPVTDEGVYNSAAPQWADAVAWQSPLTTDDAAAAMALFRYCNETGNVSAAKSLDMAAFVADVEAGGNTMADFGQGGKHFPLIQRHLAEWRKVGAMGMVAMCQINPYSVQ